tara:strand:- start:7452 stop:7793 length:342 start_codon:yes stop_codon:yes gene_type:complete
MNPLKFSKINIISFLVQITKDLIIINTLLGKILKILICVLILTYLPFVETFFTEWFNRAELESAFKSKNCLYHDVSTQTSAGEKDCVPVSSAQWVKVTGVVLQTSMQTFFYKK